MLGTLWLNMVKRCWNYWNGFRMLSVNSRNESLPWSCPVRGLSLRPPLNSPPQIISNHLGWSYAIGPYRTARVCCPLSMLRYTSVLNGREDGCGNISVVHLPPERGRATLCNAWHLLEWNPLATSLESCIFLATKPLCGVTLYQNQAISTITRL